MCSLIRTRAFVLASGLYANYQPTIMPWRRWRSPSANDLKNVACGRTSIVDHAQHLQRGGERNRQFQLKYGTLLQYKDQDNK